MPKVISRSTVSASAPGAAPASPLRACYCLCGEFVLVVDVPLAALPVRPLDGALVLHCTPTPDAQGRVRPARTFKLNATQGKLVLVRRSSDGEGEHVEKQWRFNCTRCGLAVGYETTPPPMKGGRFTHILKGALSETQGRAPRDALFGEELRPRAPADDAGAAPPPAS